MRKGLVFTVLILGFTLLSGCGKQEYKRIVVEQDVAAEKESVVEKAISGQIYVEVDSKDHFYPSFYHKGEVYGYLKDVYDNDPIGRKYLYKLDVNNKLSETVKESMDTGSGSNVVGFIEKDVYAIDYTRRNNVIAMPELSRIIEELKENRKENKYEITYVSGSNRYLVVKEIDPKGKKINAFIYDIDLEKLYRNNENIGYGEICYVYDLRSLVWIGQSGFTIYKIKLDDESYTIQEYISLDTGRNVSQIRAMMRNGSDMILIHDYKLGDKEDWNLWGTLAVTNFNFKSSQYTQLFKSLTDEKIYMEYLGQGIFMADSFTIGNNYLEMETRRVYYSNYTELVILNYEKFQEKSQQLYPEIRAIVNESRSEIFSTREIKKMINGLPTTESIIYQRINLFRANANPKLN